MAAAELGQIPGISNCFCGSMVVYQTESKIAWLQLDPYMLTAPLVGPVSAWASQNLAERLLVATPHATISAAITGHFGPGAPPELDGVIYLASIQRGNPTAFTEEIRLQSPPPTGSNDWKARRDRQIEATQIFLKWLDETLPD